MRYAIKSEIFTSMLIDKTPMFRARALLSLFGTKYDSKDEALKDLESEKLYSPFLIDAHVVELEVG